MRTTCLLIGILIFASAAAIAQPPTISLRLPSDAANGGTLAIRRTIPPQTIGPRHNDAAPILVFVPGGQTAGGLFAGYEYAEEGLVAVSFTFPGGTAGGFHSDGIHWLRLRAADQEATMPLLLLGP